MEDITYLILRFVRSGIKKICLHHGERNLIFHMNEFVYGDRERIFVNTNIGCNAKCVYCYLSDLGINQSEKRISALEAIRLVEKNKYYRKGFNGSLISIGCYSECMDSKNIEDTFQLVDYFLQQGNYVQLATKKEINNTFFKRIIVSKNAKERLWIYTSIPTITESKKIEVGTDGPEKRIKNFSLCKEYGIHSVLYIKPYLNEITDKDIDIYIDLIKKYNLPVVVGGMLTVSGGDIKVSVGENRLYEQEMQNVTDFINQIKNITKVYVHSTECIR